MQVDYGDIRIQQIDSSLLLNRSILRIHATKEYQCLELEARILDEFLGKGSLLKSDNMLVGVVDNSQVDDVLNRLAGLKAISLPA